MKTLYLLTFNMLLFSGATTAQADLLQHTQGRKTFSLDGVWDYIVDPYDAGFLDWSGKEDLQGGFYKNQKPQKYVFTGKNWGNTERVEYEFDEAEKIKVPGDWNSQDARLFFYEGAVWYRKVFNYAPAPGARQFIYLEAANYAAQVYLNGQKLGEHTGGLHGRPDEIWTEEYVDRIYQNQLAMFDHIPFLRGTCPWLLMDFRSPTRLLARKQDYYNRKGLISDKGLKKKSFYTMREWYLKK